MLWHLGGEILDLQMFDECAVPFLKKKPEDRHGTTFRTI